MHVENCQNNVKKELCDHETLYFIQLSESLVRQSVAGIYELSNTFDEREYT